MTVMLTGDAKAAADRVAAEIGMDRVESELLPGDKVAQVEKLLAEKGPKENLAFVGDGINDAPVLSRADVGIAMGALGSDAAIEAADVVLMDDDPSKIALAMKISRHTLQIVWQNIVFALAVKAVCLVLGALGIAGMWLAIFADVGVMVLAVLNATRALKINDNRKTAVAGINLQPLFCIYVMLLLLSLLRCRSVASDLSRCTVPSALSRLSRRWGRG